MPKRKRIRRGSDPRRTSGATVGPGGPHDRAGVLLDTRRAVLLDTCEVSTVDDLAGKPAGIAMTLGGRINQTQERAHVLYLMGTDGPAVIITELVALAGRAGWADADQLLTDLTDRMTKLREEGNLTPGGEG